MNNVSLKGYKATEISFVNKHENGHRIEFENKYSYNVKYSKNNTCLAIMNVEVSDKNDPEKFSIKAVVEAVFTYNPEVAKETIHVQTFKEMFPYVRAMVSSVTVSAGIPPVFIPGFDIESQNIYRFGKD